MLTETPDVPAGELPEPDRTPTPEDPPAWQPEAPVADPVAAPRGSVLPMVLGGILAAAIGGGGTFAALRAWPELIGLAGTGGLEQRIAEQDQRIADLGAVLAALPEPAPAGTNAEALIGPVQTRMSDLERTLSTLTDRIAALESRPAGTNAATPDLTAATQAMKEAEAQAQKLKEEAAALARQAARAEALARIEGALESGQPLTPGLDGLRTAGVEPPQALMEVAEGAPTIQSLRDAFPEAAREAIARSLAAQPQDTTWGRLSAFLKAQTGSRSLTPHEGNDPDAILSRAEAALAAGDLAAALAEVGALPPEGQGAMQDWVTPAARRLAATEALAALRAGGQP